MRYNKIRKMDIADGPGVRVSIFMQGCAFNCKNCFNPETHDFTKGEEFTDETIDKVLNLCGQEHIAGLSILGGEPMHPNNIEGTTKLAKEFKKRYPGKTIWAWTGFDFEKNLKDKEVMQYIDVLVDGQYDDAKRNPSIHWRGSENQRVIDVHESLAKKQLITYAEA